MVSVDRTQSRKGEYSSRLSRTSEKFRNSEEFFRMVIQNLKDYAIFTTDEKGIITSWNTGAQNVFGYDEEGVIGDNLGKLYSKQDRKNGIPEKELKIAKKKGRASDNRWHIHKDGSKFWASGLVLPLEGEKQEFRGFIKIIRDLTERKKAEDKIREAKRYAESIVQTVQLPILILNEDLSVNSANKAFYETFNTTDQKILGKKIYKLGQGHWDIRDLRELLEGVLPKNDRITDMEIKLELPDIGEKILRLNAQRLKLHSHSKILLSIEDITEEIKVQQQKDDFVNMVSHETKTPITSIKTYIQLFKKSVKEDGEREQLHSFVTKAEEQLSRLEELLDEVLQSGQAEAGVFSLEEEIVDLKGLVEDVINNIEDAVQSHDIILKDESNPTVSVDPDRIEQVLINLLNNAVKYSPNSEKIVIEILEEKDEAVVCVKDFGIGIENKHLEKIFDRYYRTNENGIGKEGFGLGLHISSQIVKEHGGKIRAESEKGKGSTFVFTLPLYEKE